MSISNDELQAIADKTGKLIGEDICPYLRRRPMSEFWIQHITDEEGREPDFFLVWEGKGRHMNCGEFKTLEEAQEWIKKEEGENGK